MSRVIPCFSWLSLTAVLWTAVPIDAQSSRGAAAPAAPAAPAATVAETANVAAVLRAVFRAAERGDLAALDTLYAGDSLTIIEGAGINRGWADYRDHHLGPELKEMKNLRYQPSDLEVHVVQGTAWVLFTYTLKADVNERAADSVGRGTAVLERRGTRWVVRHMQTGGRARRPTDPA
ncbi:MAG: nuclear transport factor 2 family protein [Gemmatimonadetes bacterium]|nr:nuclear transport factor 2 family protein [Gemmatimonadota bacterium]